MNIVKNNKAQLLFLRHAKRNLITCLEKSEDVLLTKKGIRDSFLFGEKIREQHQRTIIFHSPVKRCIQTAEKIYKGINDNDKNVLYGIHPVLGGNYIVKNIKALSGYFNKYGNRTFLRNWFNSDISEDIIIPYQNAAQKELKFIVEQLDTYNEFIINITHDWNILILVEYCFKLKFEKIGLPKYLDGIAVYRENNELYFQYKKHQCKINRTLITG